MLTITDYKNWALNDQRTAVALNGGGNALVTESNRMGGITRMFCRGAVKKMRGDVLADFTRALSARYGESIAREAVSMAGLSADSDPRGLHAAGCDGRHIHRHAGVRDRLHRRGADDQGSQNRTGPVVTFRRVACQQNNRGDSAKIQGRSRRLNPPHKTEVWYNSWRFVEVGLGRNRSKGGEAREERQVECTTRSTSGLKTISGRIPAAGVSLTMWSRRAGSCSSNTSTTLNRAAIRTGFAMLQTEVYAA